MTRNYIKKMIVLKRKSKFDCFKTTTMKKIVLLFIALAIHNGTMAQEKEKINNLLDAWHNAASNTDFNTYFDFLTEDAIYIGTDATENWNKTTFQAFAKPYFDKGKAWSFTALERNIYFAKDQETAWFDELLNTQMKICRGSGIMVKVNGQWKIKHYVLSMTIPNNNADEVTKIKATTEDKLINDLKK